MFQITTSKKTWSLKDIQSLSEKAWKELDLSTYELFQEVNHWNTSETFEFQTSGSSGTPKTITFSKTAIEKSAEITQNTFHVPPHAEVLLALPLQYVAGKMMLYRALHLGWHLTVVSPSSNPLQHLTGSFDFSALVPLQLHTILDEDAASLNRIQKILIGGAPMDDLLKRKIQSCKSQIYETYGMTETLTHLAYRKLNGGERSENFQLIKPFEITCNERNQLMVKAPHIGNEFITTQDLVSFESMTEFSLLGRLDRVINSGGIKVHPEQVEKKIAAFLDRPFYIGSEINDRLGQQVVLYIEGDPLDSVSLKLLKNVLNSHLGKFEIPKKIEFIDEFKRTSSGKIKYKSHE